MANQLFKSHSNEEQTQAIANHLPNSKEFAAKNINDSNFRQLLRIFAPEMNRFENLLLEVSKEHDINESNVYLKNWESAVGIPDECFTGDGSLSERRLHVIIKLACMNVATEEDWVSLANKLGFDVEISTLFIESSFPLTFPIVLGGPTPGQSRFFIIIKIKNEILPNVFPYTFPITFGNPETFILECVYRAIKPANTDIKFIIK